MCRGQQQHHFRGLRLVFQHGTEGANGIGILLVLQLQAPLQHQGTAVLRVFGQDLFQQGPRLIGLARLRTQGSHRGARLEALRLGTVFLDQCTVHSFGLVGLPCLDIQSGQGELQLREIGLCGGQALEFGNRLVQSLLVLVEVGQQQIALGIVGIIRNGLAQHGLRLVVLVGLGIEGCQGHAILQLIRLLLGERDHERLGLVIFPALEVFLDQVRAQRNALRICRACAFQHLDRLVTLFLSVIDAGQQHGRPFIAGRR